MATDTIDQGEDVAVDSEDGCDRQHDGGMIDSGIGGQPAGPGNVAEATKLAGVLEA